MITDPIPPHYLYTNDQAELLRPEATRLGVALRYTDHRFRGLFGGIWRAGRIYGALDFGPCLGPEVFYSIGEDDEESWSAFGESRQTMFQREAEVVRDAFEFVHPIAESFEGRAYLQLARRSDNAHRLQVFLPTRTVLRRFTPGEWFRFWKQQDAAFHARTRRADSVVQA
jgi:hypothetical protein